MEGYDGTSVSDKFKRHQDKTLDSIPDFLAGKCKSP